VQQAADGMHLLLPRQSRVLKDECFVP
jgi:hypothetical protein